MEKEECWENFLASGKVNDYLSYRQAAREEKTREGKANGTVEGSEGGAKQNAGFY